MSLPYCNCAKLTFSTAILYINILSVLTKMIQFMVNSNPIKFRMWVYTQHLSVSNNVYIKICVLLLILRSAFGFMTKEWKSRSKVVCICMCMMYKSEVLFTLNISKILVGMVVWSPTVHFCKASSAAHKVRSCDSLSSTRDICVTVSVYRTKLSSGFTDSKLSVPTPWK